MSRREEVEAILKDRADGLCYTLADEIDALRAEADLDALTICYMQGQARGDDEARAAIAERDRLAAENAEWKAAHAQLVIDYEQVLADLEASDEALEKLLKCELDPSQDGNPSHWTRDDLVSTLQAMQAILYPKEITDES